MKGEIKQYGRGRKAPDVREAAGRVDLRAQSEDDAKFLSMLYRVIFDVCMPEDSKYARYELHNFLEQLTEEDKK